MQCDLTVRTANGIERDIRLHAPADTPFGRIATQLRAVVNASADATISNVDGPLPPQALLSSACVRDGAVLTVGDATERQLQTSAIRLAIESGPDCGRVVPLLPGDVVVGRDPDCDITVADDELSRRHLKITVTDDRIEVRDLGSTNGSVLLDRPGHRVIGLEPMRIDIGSEIRVGNTTLLVLGLADPPAATTCADGNVMINRAPRLSPPETNDCVQFPAPVPDRSRLQVQWLATLAPAVLGLALAIGMHSTQFLMFAAFTPLTVGATWVSDRSSACKAHRRAIAEFNCLEAVATSATQASAQREITTALRLHPGPAQLQTVAAAPTFRVWERHLGRPHFLDLRVGTALRPLSLRRVRGAEQLSPLVEPHLPIAVDLCAGVAGIAGPSRWARGVARALVGQLATLHSPADVQLIALLDDGSAPDWRWLRWLPHASTATDVSSCNDLVADLIALMDQRTQGSHGVANAWGGAWTVLLVDRVASAGDSASLMRLLVDGPRVGVTAIVLEEAMPSLPTACRSTVVFTPTTAGHAVVTAEGAPAAEDVVTDQIGCVQADELARALAPFRDAAASDSSMPSEVGLRELFGGEHPEPGDISLRWQTSRGLAAPIGLTANGPLWLDLAGHGPHALIAGTTGSGKSELLRTLVASLAAHHPPDALSFVLIDYKGGAAFAECVDLPHTLGMVTDLDSSLTRRALVSLDAELKRRERAFAQAGVSDIDSYRLSGHQLNQPLARLVIVVDEFATLAEELPDFVSGLVGIAQRGRALGIHLILATQRPAGVVSADIKANIAIRIALRVADPGDSIDVIANADAARLPRMSPGRAIMRTESDCIPFQAARSTAPAADTHRDAVRVSFLDPWNRPLASAVTSGHKTQLYLLRDAIREASTSTGIVIPRPPWLPPLPLHLPDQPLSASAGSGLPLGLVDDPIHQRQHDFVIDMTHGGSIAFVGGPRSGKTSALLALARRAASQMSPAEVHLHAIDCAGGTLHTLEDLPHTGTIVGPEDTVTVSRLVLRLTNIVAATRAQSGSPPRILLLIDGWEAFLTMSDQLDSGRSADTLLGLMRDGASCGLTVAVTGDRSLLGFRSSSVLTHKIVLPMTDTADYALAGLAASSVPELRSPGRGVIAASGLEVQLAMPTENSVVRLRDPGASVPGPFRLRPLPTKVSTADVEQALGSASTTEATADHKDGFSVSLGLGGDLAEPILVRLGSANGEGRFLVSGPNRSGRTTTLMTIVSQLLSQLTSHGNSTKLVVAAPPRSRLVGWARAAEVPVVHPLDAAAQVRPILHDARVIVIDDAGQFSDHEAGDELTDWIRSMSAGDVAVVAAQSDELHVSFRGPAVEARRGRTGLILRPGVADTDLLGLRSIVSHPAGTTAAPQGRALLVTDELREDWPNGCPIQVAGGC